MTTEYKLVEQINSLLELDAKNALVPHGIGGLARELLTSAAAMLAAAPTQPQPIYDEAKERELFAEFSRRIVAHDAANFPIRWCDCVPDEAIEDHMNTWLACAQPRAKAGE